MTPSEVLRDAAKLIRKGWCQKAGAMTGKGRVCKEGSKRAVCWCMEGAVIRASGYPFGGSNAKYRQAWETLRKHFQKASLFDLINWNDDPSRTQEQVALKLESAAQLSERSGG